MTVSVSVASEIGRALTVLFKPEQVVELRAIQGRAVDVGYFNERDALVDAAVELDSRASVYVTLNPICPALLARSANRTRRGASATADPDVQRRRWLLIDLDPVRPSGISSSDPEHEAAIARARDVWRFLRDQGWPEPVAADSGNGAHLLYRVDLPNDAEAHALIKGVLAALEFKLGDDVVTIDTSVFNAARITKVYGTLACKGDATPERPHRRSRLLRVPETVEAVTPSQLAAVAAMLPPSVERPPGTPRQSFDLDAFIARAGLQVAFEAPWQGGRKIVLAACPWNTEHTNRSAYIVQLANGAIAAGCHHNSCRGKGWPGLRARFDPWHRDDLHHDERRVDQGVDRHVRRGDAGAAREERHPRLVRLSDVEPEDVTWFWRPLIPTNKLTLIQGDPGVGKSFLALALSTAASVGRGLPGMEPREPEPVLYLTAEDGIGDTLRPRLDAMGADVSQIVVLDGIAEGTERKVITLQDTDMIEQAIAMERPKLVVIDPIQGFLGAGVDMHRANEVRPLLAGLARLAQEYACAVIPIMHLRKSGADRAVHRGLGSIDFAAAARSILLVGQHPTERAQRVLAHIKSNLAPTGESLVFELSEGRFFWRGPTTITVEELLSPAKEPCAAETAEGFLSEMLAGGPVPVERIKRLADAAGISWRTMERAKTRLGVVLRRDAPTGPWAWSLPQTATPPPHRQEEFGGLSGKSPQTAHTANFSTWRCGGGVGPANRPEPDPLGATDDPEWDGPAEEGAV